MVFNQEEIIKALLDGEVVGMATDTIYALATLKENSDKIYEIKNRDKTKKLITFIPNYKNIGQTDEFNTNELKEISDKYWPGNNTLIFLQNQELISYRIPDDQNIISLLNNLKKDILTTSANISGEKPCTTKDEFLKRFPNIKLLNEEFESKKTNKPSKIYIIKKEGIKKIR